MHYASIAKFSLDYSKLSTSTPDGRLSFYRSLWVVKAVSCSTSSPTYLSTCLAWAGRKNRQSLHPQSDLVAMGTCAGVLHHSGGLSDHF